MAFVKSGSEFIVNTTTSSVQRQPSIAALSNGGYVVTWLDASGIGGDASNGAVHGQVFAADGTRVGEEFLVNTTTADQQHEAKVAALSNGGFVVAWRDESRSGGDTDNAAVRGQVFTASAAKSGSEFLVNTITTAAQVSPSITVLSNGNFVITWMDVSPSEQFNQTVFQRVVRGQVFTGDGTRSGSEFLVNAPESDTAFSKYYRNAEPSVSALNNGGFVVTWTGHSTLAINVLGHVFAADGSRVGGEFVVAGTDTSSHSSSSVATLSNGTFVVTWVGEYSSGRMVAGRVFAADGTALGSEFLVAPAPYYAIVSSAPEPRVTALSSGGFIVTWSDLRYVDGDASGQAVRGRLYATDGTPLGSDFLVNTTTTSNQNAPSVAALHDGSFVVAWTDESASGGDTSSAAVRAQRFVNPGLPESPVYRFFNVDTGFHFYTASLSERNGVMQTLPQFHYEGEAFNGVSGATPYTSPVYRFFHTGLGSHFYTVSESERDSIMANLSHIYSYEGTAYHALATGTAGAPAAGVAAVYRFFNYQRGSHFFTASSSERDSVIANLAHTFRYEGIACYVPAGSTTSAAAGDSLYDADAAAFFGAAPASGSGDLLSADAIGTVFDDGRPLLSAALLAAAPSVQSLTGDLAAGFTGQDPNPIYH
ncbi:hypothetical protein [Azospirillum sp. TSO22-1]|uniref:hypothetical protein n=1 Tax=Azospirillum sp. TSO22-1 TaxID=716789 RepID=UPI000D612BED|nr:hypothetical protein [Azospirillum sp. TSO22-1]PWC43106.1 hypothetical protein TSO221_20480 [Azospirillum sp. TSO22-1]